MPRGIGSPERFSDPPFDPSSTWALWHIANGKQNDHPVRECNSENHVTMRVCETNRRSSVIGKTPANGHKRKFTGFQ
jgi:hypothetical protein